MSLRNLFKFENLITFAVWLFIAKGLAYVCNSIGNTQLPQAYQTLCLVGMYPASIASAALVHILVNYFFTSRPIKRPEPSKSTQSDDVDLAL